MQPPLQLDRWLSGWLQADPHLLTLRGALTPEEAAAFVAVAERIGFQPQGSRGAAYGEAFRDNDRISVEDPDLAQRLWEATGLAACFSGRECGGYRPVGLNSNIRLYRWLVGTPCMRGDICHLLCLHLLTRPFAAGGSYPPCLPLCKLLLLLLLAVPPPACRLVQAAAAAGSPTPLRVARCRYRVGQRFGRHVDDSVELDGGRCTMYTLLIYLSSCKGGETVFYGPRGRLIQTVAPQPGLALLHLHGNDECLDHEGAVVSGGCKYVLRSDVVFEPK